MRPAADTGVLALGVLAHEEHVDVVGPSARERRRDAGQQARRPLVRPQVEVLPDGEDRAPQRLVVRHRRVADRTHQHRVVRAGDLGPVLGHHAAVLVEVRGAPRKLRPLQREAQRVDDAPGLLRHLRPHPVTGKQGDPVAQAAVPTFPETRLEVGERVVDRDDVRVLRLDVEQVRLVRRLARSPTHSRGTIVGQPYCSRSIAVARTQPLVVAPQRITVSTPCETRTEARFVPKKPDAPFLHDHRLVVPRVEPRVDRRPARRRAGARRAPAPSASRGRRP